MKKTLALIGAVLGLAVIKINAQNASFVIEISTNAPPAIVQKMLAAPLVQIARAEIQCASISNLCALNPQIGVDYSNQVAALSAVMPTNLPPGSAAQIARQSAVQSALKILAAQTNAAMVNSNIIAYLPFPAQLNH